MKKMVLTLLILNCLNILAQDSTTIRLGVILGGDYYSMKDPKSINDEIILQLPFDVATINNFPPYFYYGGYILARIIPGFYVGPSYEYHTTGSRLGQKDYSGVFSFDQIFSFHSIGLKSEILIFEVSSFDLFFDITGGVNFSNWKMKQKLTIGSVESEDIQELSAIKPFILPSFKFKKLLINNISLDVKVGYSVDIGGKYHLKENKEMTSDKKCKWNGFNVALNVDIGI